ncbi:MAG: DUF86 domain-containing protein [Gammaproteobacteria bacterium]|nr:DUF86 domain-containing protein [Gammaproteobacteria bacterium]MDE0177797.1 DUF86 domain-containing protein [Gammaproteobacteria bacterium]MDE0443353.1 DUF86 domain-containing protein [Gammaproteobacteria bacterium]
MPRDDAYLLDMLLAAREARDFASSLGIKGFRQNRMAQLAVLKAIEIVGEAASRVSDAFAHEHPDIPWRAIVGMRNRLVHDYAGIDLDRVWETVRNDIPTLIALLEPLVPPETN